MGLIGNLIVWAIIGIAAGWLAGVITKTDRSIWGDLVLGLIGALVAGWIIDSSIGPGGGITNLIWSIVAAAIVAAILVWLKNLIMGRSA